MYEVFDSFCKMPTWDTSHPLDVDRFRAALAEVIHHTDFSPEAMGEYIRANHAEPIWPKSEMKLEQVIFSLIREARTKQERTRLVS
jgi:hypothetical protein